MVSPTGYDLRKYARMVTSEPRMSAYADALKAAVTPGCTVFDIGAGPGVFSLLACQYGAGRVVAIEPDDSVELLRPLAQANGCMDRIEIFKGLSSDYSPAGKADVIVSDLRGSLPLFEHHVSAIKDARERLLAPGGTLIPMRDTIRAALAQNAKAYSQFCEEPWLRNRFDLDLSAGHRFAVNLLAQVEPEHTRLLSEHADLAVIDYRSVSDPNLSASVDLAVADEGTIHGLLIWFDSELAPGIGFSNAPELPPQIYGRVFFPVEQALHVGPGDRLAVELTARLIDGKYIWAWNSSLWRAGATHPEASFRQSTFLGKVLSPESLRVRSSDFAPSPCELHEVDSYCLSLVDGRRTLGELAELLRARFANRFPAIEDALNHVTRLTARYR